MSRSSSPVREDILTKYKDEVRAVKQHTKDLIVNVQEKITQMDNQIKNSGTEIRNLYNTIQTLQREKQEAVDKLKHFEGRAMISQKKVEEAKREVEQLHKANTDYRSKSSARLEAYERDLRLSRDAETLLRQENASLISSFEELKKESIAAIAEMKKGIHSELKADKEKIKLLEDRNAIFINENEELKRTLANMSQELANERKKFEVEQLESLRVKQALETLELEKKETREKLNAISKQIYQIDSLEEHNDKLKLEVKKITEDLGAEKLKHQQLQAEHQRYLEQEQKHHKQIDAEHHKQVEEYKSSTSKMEIEIQQLQVALSEKRTAAENFEQEANSMRTKYTKGQHQLEILNDMLQKLTEETAARHDKEMQAVRDELKRESDEVRKLKDELYRNMEELLRVREERDRIEKETIQLHATIKDLERVKEEEKKRMQIDIDQAKADTKAVMEAAKKEVELLKEEKEKQVESIKEEKERFVQEWLVKYDDCVKQSKEEVQKIREECDRIRQENDAISIELAAASKLKEELELVWDENETLSRIEEQNTSMKEQHVLQVSLLKEELDRTRKEVERLELLAKSSKEVYEGEMDRMREELTNVKEMKQVWVNDQRDIEISTLREELEKTREEKEQLSKEVVRHTQVNERLIVIQEQQMQFSVCLLYKCLHFVESKVQRNKITRKNNK
jgi:chromosome segregation ATPase